jgi:tight adherence protein B
MSSDDSATMLVALLAAFAFAGIVFAILYPYLSGEKKKDKRIASVTETRTKPSLTRTAADVASQRKKQVAETLKELEVRQKSKKKVTLRMKLERAGLDAEPRSYWIASLICGVICAAIVKLSVGNGPMAMIATISAGFIGVLGLPAFILNKMIARRQKKFEAGLANAIDVIVRGVKSGLPLNECLQIIARESPEPLASEFRYICEQQRVGVPLSEALERMIERVPIPEVKFLAIVISIQQQAGGNLSEALGNLSGVLRDRFRMAMKIRAMSSEAKASAMILGSLPPGVMTMVYLSSPNYIAPLFTTTMGNVMIAGGLFWMSIGLFVMRKMINFKF